MDDSGPDLWDKFGISKAFAVIRITNGWLITLIKLAHVKSLW